MHTERWENVLSHYRSLCVEANEWRGYAEGAHAEERRLLDTMRPGGRAPRGARSRAAAAGASRRLNKLVEEFGQRLEAHDRDRKQLSEALDINLSVCPWREVPRSRALVRVASYDAMQWSTQPGGAGYARDRAKLEQHLWSWMGFGCCIEEGDWVKDCNGYSQRAQCVAVDIDADADLARRLFGTLPPSITIVTAWDVVPAANCKVLWGSFCPAPNRYDVEAPMWRELVAQHKVRLSVREGRTLR